MELHAEQKYFFKSKLIAESDAFPSAKQSAVSSVWVTNVKQYHSHAQRKHTLISMKFLRL